MYDSSMRVSQGATGKHTGKFAGISISILKDTLFDCLQDSRGCTFQNFFKYPTNSFECSSIEAV